MCDWNEWCENESYEAPCEGQIELTGECVYPCNCCADCRSNCLEET